MNKASMRTWIGAAILLSTIGFSSTGYLLANKSAEEHASLPIPGLSTGNRIQLEDGSTLEYILALGPPAVHIDHPSLPGRSLCTSWRIRGSEGVDAQRGLRTDFVALDSSAPPRRSLVGPLDAGFLPEGSPYAGKMVGIVVRPRNMMWAEVDDLDDDLIVELTTD